jgi:hypothetical protein
MPGVVEGLALAAWLVYLLDRVLDARRAEVPDLLGARHALFHRHKRVILGCVVPVMAAALLWVALFHVPQGLLWSAGGIGALCAFYLVVYAAGHRQYFGALILGLAGLFSIGILSAVSVPAAFRGTASVLILAGIWAAFLRHLRGPPSIGWAKAPVGALLLALGCSAGVWFFTSDEKAFGSWLELILLWTAFYGNLAVISAREGEPPLPSDSSEARAIPVRRRMILVLFVLALVVGGLRFLAPMPAGTAQLCGTVLASVGLTALLWLARSRFSADAFRVLADLCLLVPAVFA